MFFESSDDVYPLRIGQTLRDTAASRLLTVLGVLGQGAYAVVYLVRESKSKKLFALKCLSKQGLAWEQLLLQREEAKLHKALGKHTNIVHLDRYFENKDWLYLVLEYCPGTDLFNWISNRNDCVAADGHRRSETERLRVVKDVFAQILEAVSFCHQRGIFHRDIKPENFMVCEDGTIKLTDFGLATMDRTSDDFDCGSKPYMSHECRVELAATYSPRLADIWSLGVLLLTLLYRRTPWADPYSESCATFARFVKDPVHFLSREFGCDMDLALFLSRRVFCSASRRVSLEEFIRRWYEGDLVPVVSRTYTPAVGKTRIGKHMRRESPWRPDATQLRQILGEIQAAHSAPSAPLMTVKKTQLRSNMDFVSNSWSDLVENDMDFSDPVTFDEHESTDVEDNIDDDDDELVDFNSDVANLIPAPTPIRPATTVMSVATAVGSLFINSALSSSTDVSPSASFEDYSLSLANHSMSIECRKLHEIQSCCRRFARDEDEDIFAMDNLEM